MKDELLFVLGKFGGFVDHDENENVALKYDAAVPCGDRLAAVKRPRRRSRYPDSIRAAQGIFGDL